MAAYRATIDDDDDTSLAVPHYRGSEEELAIGARYVNSTDPLDRVTGAHLLSQLGWGDRTFLAESVEILIRLLDDQNERVIAAAAIGLGHRGDPSAIPFVLQLLSHPNSEIRFGVVRALTGHEDDAAIAGLIQLSKDQDDEVRDWAAFGLGSILERDSTEIREALAALVEDADPEIRGEAMIGLAKRKDSRAYSIIARELKRKFWGSWCLEAAELLADPRLGPLLDELSIRIPEKDRTNFASDFESARQACSADRGAIPASSEASKRGTSADAS